MYISFFQSVRRRHTERKQVQNPGIVSAELCYQVANEKTQFISVVKQRCILSEEEQLQHFLACRSSSQLSYDEVPESDPSLSFSSACIQRIENPDHLKFSLSPNTTCSDYEARRVGAGTTELSPVTCASLATLNFGSSTTKNNEFPPFSCSAVFTSQTHATGITAKKEECPNLVAHPHWTDSEDNLSTEDHLSASSTPINRSRNPALSLKLSNSSNSSDGHPSAASSFEMIPSHSRSKTLPVVLPAKRVCFEPRSSSLADSSHPGGFIDSRKVLVRAHRTTAFETKYIRLCQESGSVVVKGRCSIGIVGRIRSE
mmetsp:Transcript_37241/g.76330  ORF Transcript_37241/g.76330 Transcript_37241/m.76330 type:complete len:314 (-) Transcript_37241:89-1030(-)|eukprot:CAMPEP_0181288282 /NCGR_PEP_ID=MMETSP1101-20121128/250_1 /TAXON_ID=46948 /ORGANISM="Rhodomonas abbreviata, Strain Caron Lab Isolate" /LENGTH=313 /DNA_ID=CAMNT_0023392395 /DNA_START=125 /DNA_END=1066 /DNA_ORIENTATION=-